MSIQNVVAQIAVSNLKGATAWYGKLLGQLRGSSTVDLLSRWRLPRGGWIQLRASRQHAGASSVSLMVNDLKHQRTAMENVGIEFDAPVEGDPSNIAKLHDPDGNCIILEQTLKPSPEPLSPPAWEDRPVATGENKVLINALYARIDHLEAQADGDAMEASARDETHDALTKAAAGR